MNGWNMDETVAATRVEFRYYTAHYNTISYITRVVNKMTAILFRPPWIRPLNPSQLSCLIVDLFLSKRQDWLFAAISSTQQVSRLKGSMPGIDISFHHQYTASQRRHSGVKASHVNGNANVGSIAYPRKQTGTMTVHIIAPANKSDTNGIRLPW